MSFTNAQLAQKISDLIEFWSSFNEEYKNWLGGAVDGGPSSDGKFPMTDYTGVESLVDCPAKLSDNVSGYVGLASASETAAAASASAASTSESNAGTSAATATAQAVLADADRIAAELAETNAQDSAVTATAQANLAAVRAAAALVSENSAAASAAAALASEVAAAASAVAAATFDPALFAALADDELITGAWTIENADGLKVLNPNRNTDWASLKYVNNDFNLDFGGTSYFDIIGPVNDIRITSDVLFRGTVSGVVKTFIGFYVDGRTEGLLQIHNGSNWGLMIKGTTNAPIMGSWTGGNFDFVAVSSPTNMVVDTTKGLLGTVARCSFVNEAFEVYGTLKVSNPDGIDYVQQSHDGTDYNIVGTNTTDINVTGITSFNVPALAASGAVTGSNLNVSNWNTAYGWGDHSGLYSLSAHNHSGVYEPVDGTIVRTGDAAWNASNWNTAYGWGNHASGGYAQLAGAALTGATLNGYALSSPVGAAPGATQIVKTTTSGYTYLGWINTVSGNNTNTPTRIYTNNGGSDGFIRYMTPANFRTSVMASYYLGISAKAADSQKLDSIDSTGFARLGTTSPSMNYLYTARSSVSPIAYFRQASTGPIVKFFKNATAATTSPAVASEYFEVGNDGAPNKGGLGIPYYVSTSYTGGKITVAATAPSSPAQGDIWFDTT